MRKFLFLVLLFTSFSMFASTYNDEPKFKLVVKWVDPSDTLFLGLLRKDPEISSRFEFCTEPGTEQITEVISPRGLSVGNIWGFITVKFLKQITPNLYLTAYELDMTDLYKNSNLYTNSSE